jgi:hypothetical protein
MAIKNQLRRCEVCDKFWQTYERDEFLYRCPDCGSSKKDHIDCSIYGNRLFTSHILTQEVYNELIFGSERGRTWHTEFGVIKGNWIEKHKNSVVVTKLIK